MITTAELHRAAVREGLRFDQTEKEAEIIASTAEEMATAERLV